MSSLKKLAIRGSIWTIASYGASQILRFGSNVILTRLLFPELFGLMTLVNIFLVGLQLFSDIGVGPSIIQNKRGEEQDFLNTAWTLQVGRGFCLWVGCMLLAWPVAQIYNNQQMLWLLPVAGLTTLIAGFNSTNIYVLNRRMAIAQLAIFELSAQLVSIVVMIVWAYFHPTIWALVIGSLASALFKMVLSYQLIPGRFNRFVWDREAAKAIFSFGKWIFISTAVTFLAEQTDRLILGKLISFEMLGVYGIAFTLSDLPRQVILAVSSKVFFPAFSKLADLPREIFRAKILKHRKRILIAAAFSLTFLVSFGDKLVSILYDQRYAQATWMLPLLAFGIWPRILTQTIDQALFALGKSRYPAIGCFCKFLFMVVGLPLGYSLKGLAGAVVVVALNDLPFYAVIAYGLWREGLTSVAQDIKATALFLILLTFVIKVRVAFGLALPNII